MKAVIVEIRNNHVAALSDDGRIYKIKNNNYKIGQVVLLKNQKYNKIIKWAVSTAAALMLFAVPAWAYLTPYSYVSIDVNPSIEFSLNRFDRVLSINAVNDDGAKILKEIDLSELKNKDIKDAVKEIINDIKESGFFVEGEESGLVVATSSRNKEKADKLTSKLKVTVEEEVKDDGDNESNVEVEVIGVGEERVQEAKELGVTPGKLNLIQKLQTSAENDINFADFNIDEWLDKPVKEIMKATKEYKENEKNNRDDEKEKDIENKENAEEKDDIDNIEDKEDIKNKEKDKENNEKTEEKNKENIKEDSDDNEDKEIVEVNDLECIITSIDKKDKSIIVELLSKKTMTVYFDENTYIEDVKGKDIKINNLKVNDIIKIDLLYKNEKFKAEEVTIIDIDIEDEKNEKNNIDSESNDNKKIENPNNNNQLNNNKKDNTDNNSNNGKV